MYLHLNLHKNRYEICFFRALGEVEVIFSKTPEDFRDYLKSLSYKWGLARMAQMHTVLVLGHILKQMNPSSLFHRRAWGSKGLKVGHKPKRKPQIPAYESGPALPCPWLSSHLIGMRRQVHLPTTRNTKPTSCLSHCIPKHCGIHFHLAVWTASNT